MNCMLPTSPGFYWARWISAYPGTRHGPVEDCEEWVIVQVFENAEPSDPAHLLVLIPGVETAQSLSNFIWGLGPLKAQDGLERH